MKESNKGSVALVMVLVVVAMITAIVAEIVYRAQVSAKVVGNRRDNAKAYELALAAFNWSLFRLQLDTSLDQIPVIPNTNYGGKKDDLSEVQWAVPISYPFAFATAASEEKAKPTPAVATDIGGSFVSALTDESSKINLNDVGSGGPPGNSRWSGAAEVMENLLLSPRFKVYFKGKNHQELLWAIDDWTDSDSTVNHTGGGVEDEEYRIDGQEYHVKNAPFYSMAEIRFLKPVNDELFRELKPFVTVYPYDARLPRPSSTPVTPKGKININTAPLEIIAALLNRAVMPDPRERLVCAQKFIQTRQAMVFRSIRGTQPSFIDFIGRACGLSETDGADPAITPPVSQILDVSSDVFAVDATGSAGDTEKTVQAVLWRKDTTKPPKILYWKVI